MATPTFTVRSETISEIDALLTKLGAQGLFNGSVLIAQRGDVLLCQGYGLADREHRTPNTAQTRYRLASLTKQFTAMAILILDSQGKVNVGDPICDYILDCPETWQAVTIHHLLTHTSGIPDVTSVSEDVSSLATPSSPEQILARFKDLPLGFKPGEKWNYSNSGYKVLGYIIEQASGQSYEDFLRQFIFSPLNMPDTGYDHNVNGLAIGYLDQYSSLPAPYIDMSIPYSAGGLYSTVEDLYRWVQALASEQLVPESYLDQMFMPQVPMPESGGWSYGYGWEIGTDNGRPLYQHFGNIEGFANVISVYPNEQITIIILGNQQDKNVALIFDIISGRILGED